MIPLSRATVATFAQLESKEWFRSVGSADGKHIRAVKTWEEALALNVEPVWEEVQAEAANQLTAAILRVSRERYRSWNDVVDRVKPVSEDLVRRKTADVMATRDLPNSFMDSVRWDLLHLGMEAEYSDLVPVGFYADLAYWYLQGNWPCGWRGDLSTGRLCVL
jgi:hypothetical protein